MLHKMYMYAKYIVNLAVDCHVENPVIISTHCCKTLYMASYSVLLLLDTGGCDSGLLYH